MKARGKTFLNESHDESGSVSWSVKTQSGRWHEPKIDASLSLRDCCEQIELDFDCQEYKHIKKRLAKLDKLRLDLTQMKEALLLAEKELAPKRFYY